MPKKMNLQEIRPVRMNAATAANCQALIATGLVADISAALRAGVAIASRLFSGDPRIFIVEPSREIFGTHAAAVAHLEALGARRIGDEWATYDDAGDPETWYSIRSILPR